MTSIMLDRLSPGWLNLFFTFALLSVGHAAADEGTHPCQIDGANAIRIAILFPSSSTGSRYRAGVMDACEKFVEEYPDHRGKIFLKESAYLNEKDGVAKLKSIFETSTSDTPGKDRVHAILGPTESGVFVKGNEAVTADPDKGIPVISPLVVTKIGNTPEGWFFRTNVDVDVRSEAIYDFLNRRDFETIAVLFADKTLGHRSEQAFSSLLTDAQKESYIAAAYGNDREEIRPTLRKILDQRPATIGIFGQRSDIKYVAKKIKGMNDGWSKYTPALFTNIDAGPLRMDDLHFVSLINPKKPGDSEQGRVEEVYGLAYDASILVFTLIRDNRLSAGTDALPARLRSRLVNFLDGPPEPLGLDTHTGMEFDNFENQAVPRVMAFQQGTLSPMGGEFKAGFEWISKSQHWLSNLMRRFGYTPLWNILLVLVTGVIINLIDLTKLYGVPLSYMRRREFLQLIAVNVLVALCVYLFMTYTGILRWDDTWGAILAVATYTVFLKAKVFGSEKAKAIGLADFYNRVVRSKHDKIMIAMLRKEGKTINYIAYTNTLVYLQKVLYEIYDFTEKDRAGELKDRLQQDLQAVQGFVDKRKVLANRIHAKLTWAELREKRLVPHDIEEKDIETRLHDPIVLVQVGADYCLSNKRDQEELEKLVRDEFRSIKDGAKGEAKEKDFDADLNNEVSSRAAFETTVLWLFIQYGFDTDRLVEDGFLPADFEERMNTSSAVTETYEEKRQHERVAVNLGVGLRERTAEAGVNGPLKSAELKDVSWGGARLNLLNCDATQLEEATEVEIVTPQEQSSLAGTIVHRKTDEHVHTVGIKWKDSPERLSDDLVLLLPAT